MKSGWLPFVLVCVGWALIGLFFSWLVSLNLLVKGSSFSLALALLIAFGLPVCLWLSVCWAMSWGGWRQLAAIYPAHARLHGQSYHCLALGCMGSFNLTYQNCVRIYLSSEGFGLKTNFVLPFHQPLFIPWEKIKSWESKKTWSVIPMTLIHVENYAQPISIYWKAGTIFAGELSKRGIKKIDT